MVNRIQKGGSSADVDTAFLQSDLTEEIYLKQPPGFEQHGPGGEQMVWGLNKSLYRCGVYAYLVAHEEDGGLPRHVVLEQPLQQHGVPAPPPPPTPHTR